MTGRTGTSQVSLPRRLEEGDHEEYGITIEIVMS
jgi:hypothetical protein